MEEELLVVSEEDKIVGKEAKEKGHLGNGILHRAITTFIFNDKKQLLIAKRSKLKKLWPGSWDTSCSTHVHENETYEQAGEKRLTQELGFSCKLKLLFKFQYKAKYKDVGSENEICGLLIGQYNGKLSPNPQEVSDYKWVSTNDLKEDMSKNPEKYTPWLKIAFKKYLELNFN